MNSTHIPNSCCTSKLILSGDFDDFITVMESCRPDGGRFGGPDGIQHAPAVQLEHTTPHEPVGRQRVASMAGGVDHENSQSLAGEEHRGRRTGASCSGDDDVVAVPTDWRSLSGGHGPQHATWLRGHQARPPSDLNPAS